MSTRDAVEYAALVVVDALFETPHDWRVVEAPVMAAFRLLDPRRAAYYGNPLCYAYCAVVAPWVVRRQARIEGEA